MTLTECDSHRVDYVMEMRECGDRLVIGNASRCIVWRNALRKFDFVQRQHTINDQGRVRAIQKVEI